MNSLIFIRIFNIQQLPGLSFVFSQRGIYRVKEITGLGFDAAPRVSPNLQVCSI